MEGLSFYVLNLINHMTAYRYQSPRLQQADNNAATAERLKALGMLPLFLLSGNLPAMVGCIQDVNDPTRNRWGSYD